MSRKAVITGGTGYLGGLLAKAWRAAGWEVQVLGRPMTAWKERIDGADVVVNLAGKSVACRYTPENLAEILQSRVRSTRVVAEAVAAAKRPPAVWLQASSLAYYGSPGDKVCDEHAAAGEGDEMGPIVCQAWEAALFEGASPARRVALRIGLVLGPDGGALEPLARLTRWFFGGQAGNGRQYLSWMHEEDFVRACTWLVEAGGVDGTGLRPESGGGGEDNHGGGDKAGVYNLCAPEPVTNAVFMRELRGAVGRPWAPPTPAWAVRIGASLLMNTDPSLALSGRRCVPRRLVEEGFEFRWPSLPAALKEIAGRM